MKYPIFILFFIVVLASCNSTKNMVSAPVFEEELLDTLVVSATKINTNDVDSLNVYNAAADRFVDLLHTKLDISFDWENRRVLGKANLTFEPIFYPTNTIELDAVGFDIKLVEQKNGLPLEYKYDGFTLKIKLSKTYVKGESFDVFIQYVAKPYENNISGSLAITSNRGLFFINHTGKENKPQQIWTQGETEYNSRWFPTIDKPNERCTQETYLTVQEKFTTLSNGLLMSSTSNNDGTRTDYWNMDKAHAPYLFMVAVGEFATIEDSWNDIPVQYFVEPKYENDAKKIFNHTPEMIEFFSNLFDYPYPFSKYSQIVVRDYVSGAMENTTASIFGEFVQSTTRELIDNENDGIVAHELIHQWFGDLVTCESWANLTLNEGFANYGEYLWNEHKYGSYKADHMRMDELNGYTQSADIKTHPLIYYAYNSEEDMFDAHSYNKGGLVLHMLRNLVGDEAFFSSLHYYLTENEYSAVEIDELRLAFEETTGLDLAWYFDQWFLSPGHPKLEVKYDYNVADQKLNFHVSQTQNKTDHLSVYKIKTEIDVFDANGDILKLPIEINKRNQSYSFDLETKPITVLLDHEFDICAEINQELSERELKYIFKNSTQFKAQYDALRSLKFKAGSETTFTGALDHPYFLFRNMALDYKYLEVEDTKLKNIIQEDPHSMVRSTALSKLSENNPKAGFGSAKNILDKDVEAFPIMTEALYIVYNYDKKTGLSYAEKLAAGKGSPLLISLSEIFAESNDTKYLKYLNSFLDDANLFQFFTIAKHHVELTNQGNLQDALNSADLLKDIALRENENAYKKYVATKNIFDLKESFNSRKFNKSDTQKLSKASQTLQSYLDQIKENESDEGLRLRYQSLN